MPGPYVHQIDPIIATVGGVHLWWYGLSYSLGFLNAHLFLRRNRSRLGLSLADVYALSFLLALGVLVGGRALVVFRHEWSFYRDHLALIPAVWLGGLATHGLIIGGFAGVTLFCILRRRPFRPIFDGLAIPAAFILGCGRIGNFIDGQIVGSVTALPWGVQFPEADGFRHPVVLYDGLKNFLLVPILLAAGRRGLPPGRLACLFVLLYAGLRIPIDMLRDYPIAFLWLPAGQTFNVIMTAAGGALLLKNIYWPAAIEPGSGAIDEEHGVGRTFQVRGTAWPSLAFAAVVVLSLAIPSDATRDIPARYAHRHEGLVYSRLYPRIGVEPQQAESALAAGKESRDVAHTARPDPAHSATLGR
jgi:phosphatidylglycerol:prolipoprotein diacylglycerol transferase